MTMKTLVVAAVAACCAAVPATASAGTRQPANCAAKGSKTLAASRDGRVLRIGPRVFACHYKVNQRYLIGYANDCRSQARVDDFRFGKGLLGFIETRCGPASSQSHVVVLKLSNGRTMWIGPPVDDEPTFAGEFSTTITSWKMRRNGSIAWIGHIGDFVTTPDSGPAPAEHYQVWKSESGRRTKLDDGTDIVPRSLAIGSRSDRAGRVQISWRKGGERFRSTLR